MSLEVGLWNYVIVPTIPRSLRVFSRIRPPHSMIFPSAITWPVTSCILRESFDGRFLCRIFTPPWSTEGCLIPLAREFSDQYNQWSTGLQSSKSASSSCGVYRDGWGHVTSAIEDSASKGSFCQNSYSSGASWRL